MPTNWDVFLISLLLSICQKCMLSFLLMVGVFFGEGGDFFYEVEKSSNTQWKQAVNWLIIAAKASALVKGQIHSEILLPCVCPVAMATQSNRNRHIMHRKSPLFLRGMVLMSADRGIMCLTPGQNVDKCSIMQCFVFPECWSGLRFPFSAFCECVLLIVHNSASEVLTGAGQCLSSQ